MQKCTFGRTDKAAAPMNHVENKIVEAVFKLREKFGTIKNANESLLESARNGFDYKDENTMQILQFFDCLTTLENRNLDTFDGIYQELKSYEHEIPE